MPPISQVNRSNPRKEIIKEDLSSGFQLDGETLQQIYEDSEKSKRRSGIFLIFILLIMVIGINILNSLFFRNVDITKYSIIFFFLFLIPVLFTKFDLLKIVIGKWLPFLQEPNDFFKRIRE